MKKIIQIKIKNYTFFLNIKLGYLISEVKKYLNYLFNLFLIFYHKNILIVKNVIN